MSKKHKVVVDNRREVREFSNKVFRELHSSGVRDLDLVISPDVLDEATAQAIDGAGWSNDGLTGVAVLLPDGRELLNPIPVAPPVSISSSELSVNDLVNRALKQHYESIAEDKEAQETLGELLDFDEDDDTEPRSPWEIVDMVDEYPAIPPDKDVVAEAPAEPAPAEPAVPPGGTKKAPKKAPAPVQGDLDEEGA